MKKTARLLFRFILIIALLLVASMIVFPQFYKDRVSNAVKLTANEKLNAQMDFSEANLSMFRHFPKLNIRLINPLITGIDSFYGDTLIYADYLDLNFDFRNLFSKSQELEVKSFFLEKPIFNLQVLPTNEVNWDIVKSSSEQTGDNSSLDFRVNKYGVSDGKVSYVDYKSDMTFSLNSLNHKGSGSYRNDILELTTASDAKDVSLKYGTFTYLDKVKLDVMSGVEIDAENSSYTFTNTEAVLNQLKISGNGNIKFEDQKQLLDFVFDAPEATMKDLLSAIPHAYTDDFKKVTSKGNLQLSGFIKGIYDDTHFPDYDAKINVADGYFQYPGFDYPVENIALNGNVSKKGGDLNQTIIDIPNFRFAVAGERLAGNLNIRRPMTDPLIDGKIKGALDLENLSKAFPHPALDGASGKVTIDAALKTSYTDIEKRNYSDMIFAGTVDLNGVKYRNGDLPIVNIQSGHADLSPELLTFNMDKMNIGTSDANLQGQLQDPLDVLLDNKVLKGELTYKSQKTDIRDYYGESTNNKNQPSSETTKSSIPPLQFSLNVDIGKLIYENYNIRDFEFNGAIDPDALRITNMAGFLDESDFEVAGTIEKPMEYMNGNQDLKGDLNLRSAFFDFNPFLMSSEVGEGQENEEELKPFFIPENLDLTLDATAGTLHYEEYIINNAKAKIKVANQKAIIDEISGKSFGGQIKMTGVYDTYKKEQPLMDVHVDLKRLNIEQAFKEIETLQKIAPIGKLLDGTFNSSFDLKSSLGNDLMPVWSSFSSKGLFEALLAKLTESDLTNKIANISGVEAFRNLNLNNTILNFEIQNGKVTCKPTKFKAAKMDMVFSGTHAIDQVIDYKLNVLVPKSMIKNKGVDAGLDLFKEQASKLGIPLNEAKDLNFDVLFTGDIKDPDVKIKLKGLEKETIKETVIETTKEVVTEKVDEVLKEQTGKDKEELEAELKARIEKIRKEARASAEKIRAAGRSGESKAKEEADKIFKQAVDEAAKQGPLAEKLATVAAEKAREKAYAEASKITKEADKRAEKVLDDAEARIDILMKGK